MMAGTRSRGMIDSLTGIRFFAALFVAIYHFFNLDATVSGRAADVRGPISEWLAISLPFLKQAHLMVDLFFVLSGFVLAHVYASSMRDGTFSYGRFLWLRIARMVPLHLFVLGLFLGVYVAFQVLNLTPKDPGRYDLTLLPANVLMVHAWGLTSRGAWNLPSWSISAEWGAYLLFPLLVALASWQRRRRLALAMTMVGFLGAFFVLSQPGVLPGREVVLTERTFDVGLLRILCEIPMGIAAWTLYDCRRIARGGTLGLVALVCALVFLSLPGRWAQAAAVVCFPLILLGFAARERSHKVPVLSHRWAVYGGEISYSIYMTHAFAITCCTALAQVLKMTDPLQIELLRLGGLLCTLALSVVTYHLVENPCRRWLTGRRRTQTTAVRVPYPTAAAAASETQSST